MKSSKCPSYQRRFRVPFATLKPGLLLGLAACLATTFAGSAVGYSASTTPMFGPNVLVFNPSMPAPAIQKQINRVFRNQQNNQLVPRATHCCFSPITTT
jgi:hypothetical protein